MPSTSKFFNVIGLAAVLASAACHPASDLEPVESSAPEQTPEQSTMDPGESLYPALHAYVAGLLPELDSIAAERRAVLDQLAAHVSERRAAGQPAQLLFICTHNSRRSHMGQLWTATAAAYYGVDMLESYSGGTEATAFNPRAVAAMTRAGFVIKSSDPNADNPRYEVRLSDELAPQLAFSKLWQDPANPSAGFAAIMTCSEADSACPFVRGAALRVALPYDDPKAADGTSEETARYDERTRQIAIEMLYLVRAIAQTNAEQAG